MNLTPEVECEYRKLARGGVLFSKEFSVLFQEIDRLRSEKDRFERQSSAWEDSYKEAQQQRDYFKESLENLRETFKKL